MPDNADIVNANSSSSDVSELTDLECNLFEVIEGNDATKVEYLISNNYFSDEIKDMAVVKAVKTQSLKSLACLLDKFPLVSSFVDNREKKRQAGLAVLEIAKSGNGKVWQQLQKAKASFYKSGSRHRLGYTVNYIEESDFADIAKSSTASDEVKFAQKYSLIDEDTLELKQQTSSSISLTTLFNFNSCQQITIAKDDSTMAVTTQSFDQVGKITFYSELHEGYKKLGGTAPSPFMLNKGSKQKPLA